MPGISFSTQIAAPAERVFDASIDFANMPSRLSGVKRVEVLTPGPVGPGTKFRETRVMFGKEATETLEVTAFERPRQYTLSCLSCGVLWNSTFLFTPVNGGTRVDLECASEARTMIAKLMSPLGALMMGSMKKLIQKDLNELKADIEKMA